MPNPPLGFTKIPNSKQVIGDINLGYFLFPIVEIVFKFASKNKTASFFLVLSELNGLGRLERPKKGSP